MKKHMTRILVVEDDWMHRDFLVRLLQIKGYDVRVAVNGEEAISTIYQQLPDIIILDMGLPGMSGYQVASTIRATTTIQHIPIIALTAFALNEDQERALAAGCDAFETKPVDFDSLLNQIRTLIMRSHTAI